MQRALKASNNWFATRIRTGGGRSFATTRNTIYIDDWYDEIRKPKEFYERFSSGKPRRYFYNIDLQGRLFLEETSPKNIATSIKDEQFLDFFFTRIQWANPKDREFLRDHKLQEEYPFLSRCGNEINHIRPAATPIVFHSLVNDTLFYGGRIGIMFESHRLAISKNCGKLYYRISSADDVKDQRPSKGTEGLDYGLISSSVGVALSNKISTKDDPQDKFLFDDKIEIDWLPSNYEPGLWAMPEEC